MGSFISTTVPEQPITNEPFNLTILDEYNLIDSSRKYILLMNGVEFTNYTIDEPNIITFHGVVSYISGTVSFAMYETPDNPYIDAIRVNPICYVRGSQILCRDTVRDIYIKIENIKPGMLVKTYPTGYKRVMVIQKNFIQNTVDRVENKIYRLSRSKNKNLFQDLYVTGLHSILVPSLTQDQEKKTISSWGNTIKICNLYRLMAHLSPEFEDVKDEEIYEIYHLVLENNNEQANDGIWANGILSESLSMETYKRSRLLYNNTVNIC
jgi:hypothetical protein